MRQMEACRPAEFKDELGLDLNFENQLHNDCWVLLKCR